MHAIELRFRATAPADRSRFSKRGLMRAVVLAIRLDAQVEARVERVIEAHDRVIRVLRRIERVDAVLDLQLVDALRLEEAAPARAQLRLRRQRVQHARRADSIARRRRSRRRSACRCACPPWMVQRSSSRARAVPVRRSLEAVGRGLDVARGARSPVNPGMESPAATCTFARVVVVAPQPSHFGAEAMTDASPCRSCSRAAIRRRGTCRSSLTLRGARARLVDLAVALGSTDR